MLASMALVRSLAKWRSKTSATRAASRRNRNAETLAMSPDVDFGSLEYQRHNKRRQEHLASLGLPLVQRSVLEVGAGISDHTSFFLDRGCVVTVTEGRLENLAVIKHRYPDLVSLLLDLDDPDPGFDHSAEIVYCYGTLYHLRRPAEAIEFMAARCDEVMLVETCVSPGGTEELKLVDERASMPSQAMSGTGSRPTRSWVRSQLAYHFPYVYLPITQPWHEEFPVDWTGVQSTERLMRAIFVASRRRLDNPLLLSHIPVFQTRH